MKSGFAVLILGLSSIGPMLAAGIPNNPPPNTDIFLYTLELPNITNGVEDDSAFTAYQFSWIGPEMFNAAPNTACPTTCGPVVPGSTVTSGESFAGFGFTSSGSDGEVEVGFSDFSGGTGGIFTSDYSNSNTVTFEFVESDAFWARPGTVAFPTDGSASFVIGTAPALVSAESVSGHDTGSPVTCQQCTLSIQDTPEPNTSALFAGALGGFGLILRKRFRRA